MKTKFFIITLLALLSGTIAYAQRVILPVDWKELKKVVSDEPELVKSLVERLTATKLDSTLTYNDRIIAFYGQALLSNNEEDSIGSVHPGGAGTDLMQSGRERSDGAGDCPDGSIRPEEEIQRQEICRRLQP